MTPAAPNETDAEPQLIVAYDAAIARTREAARGAYATAGGTTAERAHAALAALLDLAAADTEAARLCTVDVLRAGDRARAHRDRSLADLATFVATDLAGATADRPLCPSPLTTELIVGAIVELIRRHASEDRLDQLPAALPDLTLLAIAPLAGTREARRLAALHD